MALSPQEELELLQLEEEEAQAGTQPEAETPLLDETRPQESRAKAFTRKVANALPTAGGLGGGIALGLPGTVFGAGVGGIPAAAVGAGIGAAGGTAAKQLILRALGDKEGVPQTSGEAAKEIGITGAKDAALTYLGGKAFQGIGKGIGLAKDLIVKPGAAEVAQLGKEALVSAAERGGEKLALARAAKDAAKQGLISAEEQAGLHFQSTPGFEALVGSPKKMADFTLKIGRLAKKTPEELSQALDSQTLQTFRKIAQEGEKHAGLSDIAKSQLRQGKDVFTKALGISEKNVGEQLSRFREADKVVSEIPGQIKEALTKKKLSNAADLFNAKALDKKRKVINGLAKAAAVYLGAKTLIQ